MWDSRDLADWQDATAEATADAREDAEREAREEWTPRDPVLRELLAIRAEAHRGLTYEEDPPF